MHRLTQRLIEPAYMRTFISEPPLSRDDVIAIFGALADLKVWTLEILQILQGEDDEEEEAQP